MNADPPTAPAPSGAPRDEILEDARAVRRAQALRALVPLFVLSGATSLVYQSLWVRQLHLVVGTSQLAVATVLAAFMTGLAIGGFGGGRLADRARRPILAYALLEAGIGVYALLFPWILDRVVPIYLEFWRDNQPEPLVRYRLGAQNASAAMDPFEGMRRVFRDVLAWHGMPHGPEELRAHLHVAGAFPEPMTPADVMAARRYLRDLCMRAMGTGLASNEALASAFRQTWNDLGFQMPRFGARAMISYLLRDGSPSLAKWRYLFSSLIKGARYEPRTERIR